MEFIDLAAQQNKIIDKIESNLKEVLNHGKYILGPEVKLLEDKLADYVGMKYAISCASGTDALLMALMAYNIGHGDAVLTTPFTFIATAEVISLLGATPVFVDIDPETYNIAPENLEQTIKKLEYTGCKAKAIIAVDLFGLPADYDTIGNIARKHKLFIIEDAAQSFGAVFKNKRACSLGDIACTSFFPAKPLGCYGDGGMCFTNDEQIAAVLKSIRVHGQGDHKYDNVRIGINGRIDTLQAAILLAKFDIFPEEVKLRQIAADRYSELLSPVTSIKIPTVPHGSQSVWAQYSVMVEHNQQREVLLGKLSREGIPTAIYYPKPLHQQEAFSYLGYKKGDFPISENVAQCIFSLPMHPYLKTEDQKRIAHILNHAV